MRYRLTGDFATDKAGAGGTLLVELATRDWLLVVVEALGIARNGCPPPTRSETLPVLFSLQRQKPQDCEPVHRLASAAAVIGRWPRPHGRGRGGGGIVALTLGTSGVVFASADKPFYQPEGRLHAFPHALPGKWHLMGVMLSSDPVGSLRWYRDTLTPGVAYDDSGLGRGHPRGQRRSALFALPHRRAHAPPGPTGPGAFVGLTVRHTQPHLTRLVLEGVAFGLRDSFELMKGRASSGHPPGAGQRRRRAEPSLAADSG